MKQRLFTPAILILSLVSCQSRLPDLPDQESFAPVIRAETESQPGTRTVLSDGGSQGSISWKPADGINVFFGTAGTHYVSLNSADATEADFSTTDIIWDGASDMTNVWGLYPYDANASCNGSAVRTTLPAAQQGVPGTFDDDLFIMLAQSSSNSLQFKNVCGGVKFSLSRNDITSVSFKGNNNEDIAGDISLAFQNGVPSVTVVNGLKEITLTPKTGNTFASHVNYYIVTLPGTLSQGFTMTFRTTGGQIGTLRRDNAAVSIGRAAFSKKADIDTYVTFRAENTYSKVLFLGNSITKCPTSDIWWGYWGMAATREQYDYVHRVMARLRVNNPNVTYEISGMNVPGMGIWETSTDLTHPDVDPLYALTVYEHKLFVDTDLVIIRLGENVQQDKAHFGYALINLVNELKSVASNARIIITGLFWSDSVKEAACVAAANSTGSTYVEIDQYDRDEYKERVGGIVYDANGGAHAINHAAVAAHPSDLGMEMIAKEILDAIL